jgi:hypothetical protein
MSSSWCNPSGLSATTLRGDNRRRGVRYPIISPVIFQWRAADGNWHDGIGTIRNIGEDGCFVESESIPPVGSALRLTANIPAQWDSATTLRLTDLGYVRHMRLDFNQKCGFGTSSLVRGQVPIFKA